MIEEGNMVLLNKNIDSERPFRAEEDASDPLEETGEVQARLAMC